MPYECLKTIPLPYGFFFSSDIDWENVGMLRVQTIINHAFFVAKIDFRLIYQLSQRSLTFVEKERTVLLMYGTKTFLCIRFD